MPHMRPQHAVDTVEENLERGEEGTYMNRDRSVIRLRLLGVRRATCVF